MRAGVRKFRLNGGTILDNSKAMRCGAAIYSQLIEIVVGFSNSKFSLVTARPIISNIGNEKDAPRKK